MVYNWQQPDWPNFSYRLEAVEDALYAFAEAIGQVRGVFKSLPDETQGEAILTLMVSEAIKTSEIEGEFLSRQDVMSSIRNKLGLNATQEKVKDENRLGPAN